jgi:hypothetical protein
MGDDSILLWLSVEIAWGYFFAVTVGMVGALQLVARGGVREDLRWVPSRIGLFVGVLLILGTMGWFYTLHYRLIFVPGPAGLELMVLFGGGTMIAVWVTRLLAWVRESRTRNAESRNDVSSHSGS